MGTGYSGNFQGTAGAIGDNEFYQLSLTDKLPVRRKMSDSDVGIANGKNSDNLKEITVEMILAMCEHCRKGKIVPAQLIIWLEKILADSKVYIDEMLRMIVKRSIPSLKKSLNTEDFDAKLSDFENTVRDS